VTEASLTGLLASQAESVKGVEVSELPSGTVTFVFTDVEGSTRMWEEAPNLMMQALRLHDGIIDEAVEANDGVSVKPRGEGDSRFLVFGDACDALRAVAQVQTRFASARWPTPTPMRVRAALHTGKADLQLGDYYGSAVNRAARLRAIAHGGQTVLSRSTWELVRDQLPDGITVRDMGEHRLKDLTRPERVFQLDVFGLADDFPPLASLDAVPNNLPVQLTDLVGRHGELAEAEQALTRIRLLTILGPGGVGKTRLAIQTAADITAGFPDGVFFVSLAELDSSRDVIQAIAESLGVALSSGEDVKTQLLTYLRNKCQLLVFDNFERLIDAASIVTEILRAAPDVKVVVTSRTKLNVTGETVLTLEGLETTWSSPDEALQTSGVQLFLDAAQRVRPGFALEAGDLDPLAEILRLIGGLPLGILLAAAWVDMLPVSEIAAEIAKNLDFLEAEMGDVPDRHRNLRAVFDYSYALLTQEERRTFLALSVFRSGFTREAAQEVAGASLRGLSTLAAKSLVAPSPEAGRYVVHELLRQYGEAELRKDVELGPHVDRAHAAFYAGLAKNALEAFVQSDQQRALRIVEQDLDNVRSAWRYCLVTGDAGAARSFIEGLWYLYEVRGWYSAGISLFGEALDALPTGSDDADVVMLLALSGAVHSWFLSLLGQPEAGEASARYAVERFQDSPDLDGYMTAAQCWAISLAYLGRMEEMAACTDAAIAVADVNHHLFWTAAMRNWRSFGAVLAGDIATAAKLIPEAYAVLAPLNEHYFMCWNLWVQAMIATEQRRPPDAIDLLTRQVSICRDIGYMRGTMVALEALGEANVAAGSFDAAEEAFIEGMVAADKMGMVKDMLGMMAKIAKVRAVTGRPADAIEMLATVLAQPISAQQPFTDNTPLREVAAKALDDLRDALASDEYSAARAHGTSTPFEVAAKALMTSSAERRG
jgi:predicted ATPase/class 3 adenylate cyclase